MRGFTVVDLSPQCQAQQSNWYEYALLERIGGAVDLIACFSAELWKNSQEFEIPLPQTNGRLILRWFASAETAGIATIRERDKTLSVNLLASGINKDADALTLEAFQHRAVAELHDTGFEPSFDLIGLPERPLLASIGLFVPAKESDRPSFALADRCFAASYFRKLGLV
ncbi:MAG TPA: hypothetical protein VHD56_08695 [Tepidisphaeraceae bacterium]|nr:hypothetical protein [Tepidisphaeraceae bacterium]